jgi:signal transduction histidine kinase
VPLLHAQESAAVLVVRAPIEDAERASALAEDAAAVLGFVLERAALLERSAARERSLLDASERRLTRLAFDLHDGPVQDVVALAAEVRLLRQKLVDESEQPAGRGSVAARFDTLEAQLLEVGRELREVSSSLEPTKALRSVRDGLASHVEAFRRQTEIQATLELAGDFESLTASQRIAALRIVQEALANVREHSGAAHVRVSASATDGFVRIEVTDDGRGFDVERALAKAAKDGRLGLVGMSERVRLLGGRLEIASRPGGPTTISAVLRLWCRAARADDALADAPSGLAAQPSAPAIR